MTPQEALDAVQSRLEAFENDIDEGGARSMSPEMATAIETLQAYLDSDDDLEWGEPGDCLYRIANDPDIATELQDDLPPGEILDEDSVDDTVVELAKRLGFGRHYGNPHCIWCLQGE